MIRDIRINHITALAVLICLTLLKTWYAFGIGFEYKWTGDTSDTLLGIVNAAQGTRSTANDQPLALQVLHNQLQVVQNLPIRSWYQAAFDSYLETVLLATGDISLAYKYLVFPINLLFLSGAYLLFLRLGLSIRAALVLAILSSLHFSISWAGEKMGIGPIWTYSRRHLFTAFLPWLTLGYLLFRARILQTLLFFCACGLVANLHASGLLLIQIFALTWLVSDKLSPKRIGQTFLLVSAGSLCAFYALGSIWGRALEGITELLISGVSPPAVANTLYPILDAAKAAMPETLQYLSYPPREYDDWPRLLIDLWFALSIVTGLLIVPTKRWLSTYFQHTLFTAVAISLVFVSANEFGALVAIGTLLYLSRNATSAPSLELATTSLLIVCTYWISVVGGISFQIAHVTIPGFPLVWDQFRGMRFLGFFVFTWIGALLIQPPKAKLPRWHKPALAIAILFFMFGQLRDFNRQHIRFPKSEDFVKRAALLEIASWARKNTPAESIFLVGSSGFGITANRRVTHSDKSSQFPDAPPLAPRDAVTPTEGIKHARSLHATHVVLDAGALTNVGETCVLVANNEFLLAETSCLEQRAHREDHDKSAP